MNHLLDFSNSKPKSIKDFSLDVSCMALVIAIIPVTRNWFFELNVPKKSISSQKLKKINTIELCIFKLICVTKFQLKPEYFDFRTKFVQKWYFQYNTGKVTITIQILGWSDNFEFSEQICPKREFLSKTEIVNSTFEFYIFELFWVPNFSENWQFWFFE